MKCCICGKKCEDKYGNNPYPLFTGKNERCCNECNDSYVLFARLNRVSKDDKEAIEKVLQMGDNYVKGERNGF